MKIVPICIRNVHGVEDFWVLPDRDGGEESDTCQSESGGRLTSKETDHPVKPVSTSGPFGGDDRLSMGKPATG